MLLITYKVKFLSYKTGTMMQTAKIKTIKTPEDLLIMSDIRYFPPSALPT